MRIKGYLLFLTIFFIGIIQSTALSHLSVLGVKPDLLLVCVIFFTLYFGKRTGIAAAILGGLFKDITSTAIFGSNAFGFCLCALFLGRYGRHFYKQKISTQILLCGLLYYIITFLVLFLGVRHWDVHYSFLVSDTYHWLMFKAAIYTGCISPLLFFVLKTSLRTKRSNDV